MDIGHGIKINIPLYDWCILKWAPKMCLDHFKNKLLVIRFIRVIRV